MFAQQFRLILAHATPMWIAHLASMGMMVIDTALLGHYGTEDLAAVAVNRGAVVTAGTPGVVWWGSFASVGRRKFPEKG
jgi:Na+-driven multidrug efflux pump